MSSPKSAAIEFERALRGIVRVPKQEVDQAEKEYKAARKKAKALIRTHTPNQGSCVYPPRMILMSWKRVDKRGFRTDVILPRFKVVDILSEYAKMKEGTCDPDEFRDLLSRYVRYRGEVIDVVINNCAIANQAKLVVYVSLVSY